MNIAEILKDCPKGTRLYSPLFGDVQFYSIQKTDKYSICVTTCIGNRAESFTDSGLFIYQCPGECMLFPSKENRDWSTFKAPKKEKEYEFKPFDKVLVRDSDNESWQINLFGYTVISDYKYQTITGGWKQCIPFEGNEHLLGTSDPA